MIYLFWFICGILGLWFNVILSEYVSVFGLKPNILLTVMLVMTLQHPALFLAFLGIFMGITLDSFSHGMQGIYGTSFFITLILTRFVSNAFYEKNIFSTMLFVFVLSAFEGAVSLFLLGIFNEEQSWSFLFLGTVLPVSGLHTLVSPVIFLALIKGEQIFHLNSRNAL
ncbi:MAG: rod shape-determining protein MreD [SAR324 cluster bacterium]|nr:rod shape-determining protein MreD [SAR324 cluster bacterium]